MKSLFLVAALAYAHDPITTQLTWSGEISRIVYKRCAGCHHDGANTPMALLDYEQVRPWAKAIRDEVLSRRMPPWGAVKGYGEFANDLSLTQDEMNRVAEWVQGGAPEGDPKLLPPRRTAQPELPDINGTRLRNPSKLKRAVTVLGIAPSADVASAKIYAQHPDGTIEPLLWLLNYQDKWQRTFIYKQAVHLPAGTVILASQMVHFDVVIDAKSTKQAR